MSTLNESLIRTEMPLAAGEVALPGGAAPAPARRHSGFGVASFVWSLLVGPGEFMIIALTGILGAANPDLVEEPTPLMVALGLLICAGVPASLGGLALAVVGLVQKDRKKVFSVLGLIFNAMIILGIGLLMLIGSQMP